MSSNEDGIRVIRYAALIIDKLAPQVVLFFYCAYHDHFYYLVFNNLSIFHEPLFVRSSIYLTSLE